MDGVTQLPYGDCFFEAALASLADTKQGQQLIKNMIKENKDGSYTVTFPGDPKHPIRVTAQDLKNSGTKDGATWGQYYRNGLRLVRQ